MMEHKRPDACPSDLTFDALTAAELEPGERDALEQHVAGCSDCQARRSVHAQEREAFLALAPSFGALRTQMRARTQPPRHPRRLGAPHAWAAAALCAAALLAVQPWRTSNSTRSKGAPRLGLFIKRVETIRRGATGDEVSAGELLRFTYSSDTAVYFALLNVDARGARAYFPSGRVAATRLPSGQDVALDFSVELDAEPGVERMLGVFCQKPFETTPLIAALVHAAELPEMPGCHVDEMALRKRQAP